MVCCLGRGGLRFRYEFFITLLTPSGEFSSYACALRVFAFPAVEDLLSRGRLLFVVGRGEGGDRAIGWQCGGVGMIYVLLFSVFVSFVDGV